MVLNALLYKFFKIVYLNFRSFSASQSSSIAAGLNGISASDSNAFAANHPLYGPTAQANGNSFAVGQAAASAHGDVVNGQAVSSAQSSVGGTQSQASSSANAASSGAKNQNLIHLRPERPVWGNAQPNYASGINNGIDQFVKFNRFKIALLFSNQNCCTKNSPSNNHQ